MIPRIGLCPFSAADYFVGTCISIGPLRKLLLWVLFSEPIKTFPCHFVTSPPLTAVSVSAKAQFHCAIAATRQLLIAFWGVKSKMFALLLFGELYNVCTQIIAECWLEFSFVLCIIFIAECWLEFSFVLCSCTLTRAIYRDFKQTTTVTATRTWENKSNWQNNNSAHAF